MDDILTRRKKKNWQDVNEDEQDGQENQSPDDPVDGPVQRDPGPMDDPTTGSDAPESTYLTRGFAPQSPDLMSRGLPGQPMDEVPRPNVQAPGYTPSFPAPQKPQSKFQKIMGGVKNVVESGIDAASTPNIAHGGATDIFRGMAHAGAMADERKKEEIARSMQQWALQHQQNADTNAWAREQETARHNQQTEQEKLDNDRLARSVGFMNQGAHPASQLELNDLQQAQNNPNYQPVTKDFDKNNYKPIGGAMWYIPAVNAATQRANTNNDAKSKLADKNNAVKEFLGKLKAVPELSKLAQGLDVDENGNPIAANLPSGQVSPVVSAGVDKTKAQTDQINQNVKYLDARTGEVRERTSEMPRLLAVREKLASVAQQNANSGSENAATNRQNANTNEYRAENTAEKLPAQQAGKVAQAKTIIESANDLEEMVAKLRNEGKIGPLAGRAAQAGLAIGLHDPEAKELDADLKNLASLQPFLHGMRGTTAYHDFVANIGGIEQDPDNILSALHALKTMAGKIEKDQGEIQRPTNAMHPAARPGAAAAPVPGQAAPVKGKVTLAGSDASGKPITITATPGSPRYNDAIAKGWKPQ